MHDHEDVVAQGLARYYRGRLIPIMKGASEDEPDPLFADVPEDLSTLDDAALTALIDSYTETIEEVKTDPDSFVSADTPFAELFEATKEAIETLKALKAEAASRAVTTTLTDDEKAELAALSTEDPDDDKPAADGGAADPPADDDPPADEAAIAAAAAAAAAAEKEKRVRTLSRLPRPNGREPLEHDPAEKAVAIVASGGAPDRLPGEQFTSDLDLAEAMISRHRTFGDSGPDVVEKFKIARADWRDDYPEDRMLGQNIEGNFDLVKQVIDPVKIKAALRDRIREQDKDLALVASGGLCAPVTPYYNLQYISVPERPVQAALPSFVADRGGLRYARPAALSAVTTGTGLITEAQDAAGGTFATKTCQTIPCPPFQETDVDIIYHCLQFGNLGARVFPELVAQWNNLVLASHARLAESNLLTGIDTASTQVTAGSFGLGASATLFSQILAAANGLRNRNRMDPEAVLRIMLPWWAVDLIVSDVIRTQFERFDTNQEAVIALLRSFNIEPTFYIDGANGRAQVFATQVNGPLLAFPPTVVWYLFPEGSFLYLDAGTLELGIVRDSVLNKTNDFQIFGETFENVAFVGVESLAVETFVCDSGTVSLPAAVTCPIAYNDQS